jgi:hypothetical protein
LARASSSVSPWEATSTSRPWATHRSPSRPRWAVKRRVRAPVYAEACLGCASGVAGVLATRPPPRPSPCS